ncbi:hypothetical protein V5O48_019145, partial [Marasmius crinis-equi]
MGKRQSKDKRARAKQLKEEANALFTKKDFKAAISRYTEAISLDIEDIKFAAVLYCNRAACHLSRMKYDEAATDATKAASLDPTYARAWARLAIAKEKLKLPLESTVAWKKAVLALQKDDLSEEEGRQRAQYKENLSSGLEAMPMTAVSPTRYWQADLEVFSRKLLQSFPPWRTVADGTDPRTSSVWVIRDAFSGFNQFNSIMGSFPGPDLTTAQAEGLKFLSNAILIDP